MLFTTSPLLAARHGFSTRQGGVSEGRYATLNLGAKWGDEPARIEENRRRLSQAAGFELARLFTARQVHGTRVVPVAPGQAPASLAEACADALMATAPGAVVGVYTADCVPILLEDGEGRVAAVHAGWRGTLAGVAREAVEALVAAGARRERLVAAFGPSICGRCYEVGEEVAAPFERVVPAAVVRTPGKRPHVDLHLANRSLLEQAGVRKVGDQPPCTLEGEASWFSFRRDGAMIGQQLSFIVAGRPIL